MKSEGNDDQLRWGLGAALAGGVALLPLLVGRADLTTTLVVSAIASIAVLPVWRYAGAALRSTVTFIPLLEIVIGTIVIARLFGAGAIATYIGAWLCTLGILRFVTRRRDTG